MTMTHPSAGPVLAHLQKMLLLYGRTRPLRRISRHDLANLLDLPRLGSVQLAQVLQLALQLGVRRLQLDGVVVIGHQVSIHFSANVLELPTEEIIIHLQTLFVAQGHLQPPVLGRLGFLRRPLGAVGVGWLGNGRGWRRKKRPAILGNVFHVRNLGKVAQIRNPAVFGVAVLLSADIHHVDWLLGEAPIF